MYESHFGLSEPPFSLTPDTGFFFNYRAHREALEVLEHAVRSGEGFLKITGEVGTGKTLLCRKLLNALDSDCVTAYIPNPFLEPDALRRTLAKEIGLRLRRDADQNTVVEAIYHRLIRLVGRGRRVVLCVDEAQALPDDSLEAIRLLTNLETEKRKLLQVVLFGQPELDHRLAQPNMRQLLQRISFSYTLRPLDRPAVQGYLNHRLAVAGYNGEPLFDRRAVTALYRASGGVPRLLNVLAHKSLIVAFGKGAPRVDTRHVRRASADTEGVRYRHAWGWRFFAAGALTLAVTGGILAYGGLLP